MPPEHRSDPPRRVQLAVGSLDHLPSGLVDPGGGHLATADEPDEDGVPRRPCGACAECGAALSALDLYAVDRDVNATTRAVAGFFAGYDVLLTPTSAAPSTAIGHLDANDPRSTPAVGTTGASPSAPSPRCRPSPAPRR
jgi:hypothetical protein